MNQLHKHTRTLRGLAPALTFLTATAVASGTTMVYEGFDIPAGDLHGTSGATSMGWDNEWHSQYDDDGPVNQHTVTAGGLTYPNLATSGGALQIESGGEFALDHTFRVLDSTYDSGSMWASALIRLSTTAGGTGSFQISYQNGDYNNNLYMGTEWAGSEWQIGRGPEGDARSDSGVAAIGDETFFLVMHMDFAAEEARFWVNPESGIADPGAPATSITSEEFGPIDRVSITSGSFDDVDFTGTLVDELRIGTSYEAVAPIPEPSAYAALAGLLALALVYVKRRKAVRG